MAKVKDYYIELRDLLLNEGKEFKSTDIKSLPKEKGIYIMFENGQKDDGGKARIIRVGKADRNFQTRLGQHFSGTIKNSVFRKHILSALLDKKKINKKYKATEKEEQQITNFLQNITFRLVRVPKLLTCEELESMCIRTVAKHSQGLKSSTLNEWVGQNCKNKNVQTYHIWNSDDVNYKNELDAYYFDLIECGLVRR